MDGWAAYPNIRYESRREKDVSIDPRYILAVPGGEEELITPIFDTFPLLVTKYRRNRHQMMSLTVYHDDETMTSHFNRLGADLTMKQPLSMVRGEEGSRSTPLLTSLPIAGQFSN